MENSIRINRAFVEDILSEIKGKHVLYAPNPGNAGDALIGIGILHAMERKQISYTPITSDYDASGNIVVIGGGGNLVPLYSDVRKTIDKVLPRAKRIIVLPHTIRGNEDLLQSLSENATVICRDPTTYIHVLKNTSPKVDVAIAHDMAFHTDVEKILYGHRDIDSFKSRFEKKLLERSIDLEKGRIHEHARFGRHDEEKGPSMGPSDLDISEEFAFGTWPGSGAELSAWCLLTAVQAVKQLETDRLHVGISSALLGKNCILHDNSYGKNKNVYNHSLRKFKNITYKGETPESTVNSESRK